MGQRGAAKSTGMAVWEHAQIIGSPASHEIPEPLEPQMIDATQRTLEWMAPELESYRKRQIFTAKQIQRIVENRRRFENKLQRTKKKLVDFLAYIESERNLEKIRNKRVRSLGTGPEESDLLLQANIIKVYKKALYYCNEPILLKDFSEYCKKKRAFDDMKEVFASKCLKHMADTDLWVYCAQELWEIGDVEGARILFMKGIAVNPDPKLRVEFFRLECLYATKLTKISEEMGIPEDQRDETERGGVARLVFESLVDKLDGKEIEECAKIAAMVPGLEESIRRSDQK